MRAAVNGEPDCFQDAVAYLHLQASFILPSGYSSPIITLSGGVGELVYLHLQGNPWPPTTCYGDLGIDLARRLIEIPEWLDQFRSFIPSGGGRATVYGLLRHCTQVSGNTLFLPDPQVLPLRNVPIIGSISPSSSDGEIDDRLNLAARSSTGCAMLVNLGSDDQSNVQAIGKRLGAALVRTSFPRKRPLILIVDQNVGKILGNCITSWGNLPINLIVVDEVNVRAAQFVQLGKLQNHVVPVSLFGI
jgi:ethanolamine utilization protein EutA